MNLAIVRRLAMFCLTGALASISLMAQSPLRVTIPFDFTVGSKAFTSGEYFVRPNVAHSVLSIQSANYQNSAMAQSSPVQARKKSGGARLVFNRYGDRYFLSQVWADGSQGRELLPSRAERELIAQAKSAKRVDLVATGRE